MLMEEATAEVPQLQPAGRPAGRSESPQQGLQTDFHVDGWKPSLLERVARMLGLN